MKLSIAPLVALGPSAWHELTLKMSWVYRAPGRGCPPIVLAVFGGRVPDRQEWHEVRAQATKARRKVRFTERHYIELERKLRRRRYMAGYMKQYRRDHPDA